MAQSVNQLEDQATRSTGKVVRFHDKKGYGFIKPDDGGEDLFVHQTAIKSDGGYRTLSEGDAVEFTIVLSDNRYQAVNVTAPGGAPIHVSKGGGSSAGDGFAKRPSGFGGSWNRRNNGSGYGGGGAGGAGCYNCGNPGHLARDCNGGGGGGEAINGGCFKCGNTGHFARDCPRANNGGGASGGGGGGGGRACFNCGGFGHMARDCPGGGGACYNCGGYGHLARDCTSARVGGGGGSGRFGGSGIGGGGGCFNCGKEGHFARECPNNS